MGTYYRDNLARQGREELAHGIYDAWNDGRREEATAMIDDDLLDAMAVGGTPEHARDLLAEFEAVDGVDAVSISFPRGASVEEILATMEALAPEA
jgi:uncharacterized membrane protein